MFLSSLFLYEASRKSYGKGYSDGMSYVLDEWKNFVRNDNDEDDLD